LPTEAIQLTSELAQTTIANKVTLGTASLMANNLGTLFVPALTHLNSIEYLQ